MWHGLALVFSTCVIWGKSHNFCVALTSYGWCKSKWVKCMSSIVLATMSAWQPTPLNGLKQSFCLWIYDVSRAWQDSFIPAPLDVVSEQHKGWGLQSPESSLTVWLRTKRTETAGSWRSWGSPVSLTSSVYFLSGSFHQGGFREDRFPYLEVQGPQSVPEAILPFMI